MKAAVWQDYGVLEVCEVPEPEPKNGEVKIKVMSAGLCITDLHVYTGQFIYGKPPHILGHEIAGEVCAIGEGVPAGMLGKRVVVETSVGCGICNACRSGNRHLCPEMTEIGFTPHPGGYAQYTCAPWQNLIEIPEGVGYDEAGIIESVVCPAGSLMRLGIGFGETVAVIGVGPAGLAYIQTAKLLGAGKVIALARSDESLARAKQFGADAVINTKTEHAAERLLAETGGEGASLVIEAAGVPETIELAFQLVQCGGRVILYGIPGDDQKMEFPVQKIITQQLSVYGAVGNPHVWAPLLQYVAQGRINLKDMVTATFPLAQINEGFDLMRDRSKHLIKAVLHPWEEEA